MKNLTNSGKCYYCEKKFKYKENVYQNPIETRGKRKQICISCYNFKNPRILKILFIFVGLFVVLGIVQFFADCFFSESKILNMILGYSFLVLLPVFLFFGIFVSKKKIVNK